MSRIYVKKDIEGLNDTYQLIVQATSVEDMLKLYHQFKGLTITFPTKLISKDYIVQTLKIELLKQGSLSIREIQYYARRFDYSERQIKRFVQKAKEEIAEESEVREDTIPYIAEWINWNQHNKEDKEKNERN